MYFQIGDTVTVRPDIRRQPYWMAGHKLGLNAAPEMVAMAGKKVTISGYSFDRYQVFESAYLWTDDMFAEFCSPESFEEDSELELSTEDDLVTMILVGEVT